MANFASTKVAVCILQSRCLKTLAGKSLSLATRQTSAKTEIKETTKTKTNLSASYPPQDSSFTANFLMNSYGFPPETALSVSKKFQLDSKRVTSAIRVLSCLKSYGFSETQTANLVLSCPNILSSRSIEPKLKFLVDNGFVGSHLHEICVTRSSFLMRSLGSHLKPLFEFLMKYIRTHDRVVAAIKVASWMLSANVEKTMQPNVDYLIKQGMTADRISDLIALSPRPILQKYDRIVYGVETLRSFGIEPNSPIFIHAFRVVLSMTKTNWDNKVKVFKSFGWSEEDIISAFRREPFCLSLSEEKLRNNVDLFVNVLKLDQQTLVRYPRFLMCSTNSLQARYDVIKILESKGLVKGKIIWILTMAEKSFIEKIIKKNLDQAPDLLELYLSKKEKKKTKKDNASAVAN